jgi:hypothetical protein
MKTPLLLVALLLAPALITADDAPASAPAPTAALEVFPKAAAKEKGGEFRARMLEKLDADKNGTLSDAERAKAWAARKNKTTDRPALLSCLA